MNFYVIKKKYFVYLMNKKIFKTIKKCHKDDYLVPNNSNNILSNITKWSNTIGYGNIQVSSTNCSYKYPWNRIPSLILPTATSEDPKTT